MVVTDMLHLKRKNFGDVENENESVQRLASPHIESFNYFLEEGLASVIRGIPTTEFKLSNEAKIGLTIMAVEISKPSVLDALNESTNVPLYPKECIERGISYRGNTRVLISWSINDERQDLLRVSLGSFPIMVKSKKCHLHGLSPKELVEHGELASETGGYFILNGSLRVLRLLVANRRNYPLAVIRDTWKSRDDHYSNMGILVRSVRCNGINTLNVLHYLVTGEAKLEIKFRREWLYMPLILCLKILRDVSDRFIYKVLIMGREEDTCFAENIKMMLRQLYQKMKLITHDQCISYVGSSFKAKIGNELPEWATDEDVCHYIVTNLILVHLPTREEKFDFLCCMARKLYAFVKGDCVAESLDVVSMQEAYLGGFTYLGLLKEKLEGVLRMTALNLIRTEKEKGSRFKISPETIMKELKKFGRLGDTFAKFIGTGNLSSKTGLGLSQQNGLTIIIDHLNRLRDLSHLRALHRGSYFLEMKTTVPRRLTGEAWGFICPVHTPDGSPCGLLNHLTFRCEIPCHDRELDAFQIPRAMQSLGMVSLDVLVSLKDEANFFYEVILDGGLVGYVAADRLKEFVLGLRALKVKKEIYPYTEIVPIIRRKYGGQYPGLFVITSSCRLMRPVINLKHNTIEYIGTLEQNYLNIATCQEEVEDVHSHVEIDKLSLFSNVGMLVPFSDCNPNPRNMYQCQMGKQSMGTPLHNFRTQTNHKLYRLLYPQVPLVRNKHYDEINLEEFCLGFNAVLAIVSYTGCDMEDAMVVNKCSMERGFAHGFVYLSEFVDLTSESRGFEGKKYTFQVTHIFQREPNKPGLSDFLDTSGLPYVGTRLTNGDPYYCTYDIFKKEYRVVFYKGQDCVVDKCTVLAPATGPTGRPIQRVNIVFRIRRNPTLGDKFASRSGQKGIMSRLYPGEDMPFSERGIVPDIIFNPHGIPSRMTAGKLIELVAGKSAAEFGLSFDSSPFQFNDENPAHDYFGEFLKRAGFNYYGEDVLYSGIDGRPMNVEVFEGIVYYQRLRHMVDDKWQVRSTGKVDDVTRQPIKGRKRGGAIRFGEMERDALITHGTSLMLKDRLMDCCDASDAWLCASCGDMLSTAFDTYGQHNQFASKIPKCFMCDGKQKPLANEISNLTVKDEGGQTIERNTEVVKVKIPYAFRFLVSELASVNIRLRMGVKKPGDLALKKQPQICEKAVE